MQISKAVLVPDWKSSLDSMELESLVMPHQPWSGDTFPALYTTAVKAMEAGAFRRRRRRVSCEKAAGIGHPLIPDVEMGQPDIEDYVSIWEQPGELNI
ncbi:hypothetical protein FQR65_LT15298 [Abscondita terminalis]|nr:hypothetical protein FQR65_LT15298 [Abscondita terminalis]